MRSQPCARRSSGSRAFTACAFDGRGAGSVVTQWFTRNSGEPARPRLSAQLGASAPGPIKLVDGAEREGRLLGQAVVRELVPRRRAGLVLGQDHEAAVVADELPQGRPVARGRRVVDEVGEPGGADGADEVARRDVVLVDHDEDLAGMGDEEVVDRVEAVGERGRAELAEAVAEVHAALALAAEAEPVAQAQRRGERLVAHAVLRGELPGAAAARRRSAPARSGAGRRSACRSAARGSRRRAEPRSARPAGSRTSPAAAPTSSCASRGARRDRAAGRTARGGRCSRRRPAPPRSRRPRRRTARPRRR